VGHPKTALDAKAISPREKMERIAPFKPGKIKRGFNRGGPRGCGSSQKEQGRKYRKVNLEAENLLNDARIEKTDTGRIFKEQRTRSSGREGKVRAIGKREQWATESTKLHNERKGGKNGLLYSRERDWYQRELRREGRAGYYTKKWKKGRKGVGNGPCTKILR